ncbi:MAG: EAL domain-containing protein [Dactylosporangium sp.]|nr:EAL domain-containing protein [Dactylosporangium sp.]NNJ63193.1 EAL domain-containing protein [Dactylosporangium sp.]
MASSSWSTSQLVEFLAVLSDQDDEANTLRAAVERVLESLDAEVGVLLSRRPVPTVVGLQPGDPQIETVVEAAKRDNSVLTLPGLGVCRAAVVMLDLGHETLRLFVVRAGFDEFVPDEMLLLRGMAWVLHLALRPLRMLVSLNEQQGVLERVSRVQRAIANRAPLPEVFDAVTEGALGLFGCELAMLYLAEQGILMLASVSVVDPKYRPPEWPVQLRSSIGRAAYSQSRLVRTDDYPRSTFANPHLVSLGCEAAMAAPVRENGAVVGCLVTMVFRPGCPFTDVQEQTMLTFADQISTALSDAKTLATAQHAIRDSVTGLPNRVFFLDRLEQAIARGLRAYVLFLDLDRFKYVNDTLGHMAGDDLLRQVGRRLRECLHSGDCLARFGGDEFAVLVEDGEYLDLLKLGSRLLIAAQAPYLLDGNQVNVGASIGIAVSQKGSAAGDVLRDADTAMYRAKHAGGDRLVVFEQRMHTVLVQRASLETDLRHAIERGELFPLFQPICELQDGTVAAAEALVRWRHPTRGMIGPGEFVPLAEETGLIVPIGRQILRNACEQAVTWPVPTDGTAPLGVSVNLSAQQLYDPYLVADVRHTLSATGLDPARLLLEITESTLISDAASVVDRLRQIKDIGVRLAIDDFGTGYSSLSYLRRFPVDTIKIDRSFVEGIAAGWQGRAFLHTIVRLADTLSMTAVGEGIETEEQLCALRMLGCDFGQGFLFARPMTSAEFSRSLRPPAPVPCLCESAEAGRSAGCADPTHAASVQHP